MKVKLAGYNVDADQLYRTTDRSQDLTPETISAAYARISRSPKPVDELRVEAREDVAKARESNKQIVFDFGHSSVAEHAVFNFDLMDVSRLVIELVEHARLASYTEKSQRYLKLNGLDEVYVPLELQGTKHEGPFRELAQFQMDSYQEIYKGIREYLDQQDYARSKIELYQLDKDGPSTAQKNANKGKAKEDARYVTPLAVYGQLGMTLNARVLEFTIRRLMGSPLYEAQDLAKRLYEEAVAVTPSLIRYCEAEPIRDLVTMDLPLVQITNASCKVVQRVKPLSTSISAPVACNADEYVLAVLLFQTGQADFSTCLAIVKTMEQADKWKAFLEIYKRMERHSAAPRGFEMPEVAYELIGSASFFAQLKRHRIATILPQAYDPSLGCTMPDNVEKAGLASKFTEVMDRTTDFHYRLHVDCNLSRAVSEYVLTQAHRRRVLVKMNARQLYAFSRQREDGHAQWEIRKVANELIRSAKQIMPMTLALACGKDMFDEVRRELIKV